MVKRVFACVVVDDLKVAGAWYGLVLGREADAAPMAGLLEWHLTPGGWLQVVDIEVVREVQLREHWGTAGSSSVAFVIESLDDQLAVLRENGIAIGPQYTTTASLKTATVVDPAGNLITFVEEPSE
jgi:hypothetical protein